MHTHIYIYIYSSSICRPPHVPLSFSSYFLLFPFRVQVHHSYYVYLYHGQRSHCVSGREREGDAAIQSIFFWCIYAMRPSHCCRAPIRPVRLACQHHWPQSPNPSAASQLYVAHGLLGNAGNWATASRHLIRHPLLRERLRCITALDMRNHGASPSSPDHSSDALSSDLEAVVLREQQSLKQLFPSTAAASPASRNAVLMGHSMGGLAVMGALLRRANEEALLPTTREAADSNERAVYGHWSPTDRQECVGAMRAVNEDFGFAPSQPISRALFSSTGDAEADDGFSLERVPQLGRVAGAVIVDITPTVRLGSQRTGNDNVLETLHRMKGVDLSAIHSYDDAKRELVRVGMTDSAMRDFVTTNLVLSSGNASWRCNLPVLVSSYQRIHPSIVQWYDSTAVTVGAHSWQSGDPTTLQPKPCMLPVLFVFGSRSPYNEKLHREVIPRFFPRATQVVVDGAGHFVHYEKTAAFVEAVAPFIASLVGDM